MTSPVGPNFGTPGSTDINRMHDYDDLDISTLSHHHTLGSLSGQAAPGNHVHDGKTSSKLGLQVRKSATNVLAGAGPGVELKDTGIGDTPFTPVNGGIYIFKYKARGQAAGGAPISADVRLRYALAPASPSNTSPILEGISLPLAGVGGAFAMFFVCEGYAICPDDLAAGVGFIFAPFYTEAAGPVGSTFSPVISTGSRRQFTITLDGFK